MLWMAGSVELEKKLTIFSLTMWIRLLSPAVLCGSLHLYWKVSEAQCHILVFNLLLVFL